MLVVVCHNYTCGWDGSFPDLTVAVGIVGTRALGPTLDLSVSDDEKSTFTLAFQRVQITAFVM